MITALKHILIPLAWLLAIGAMNAQVTGKWKYIDEQDGQAKSIIEVYQYGDRYHGRIVELLPSSKRTHCERCFGELKGKPLIGMNILYDLKITSNGGRDGKILDPGSGKIFNCSIELESQDKLKVRGYLGVPTMGKTQYWSRLK
jgi:uncharacterized protein (DUF2147 family)